MSQPDQQATATKAPETAGLFSNRTFLAVWIGHTISQMGDGFGTIAIGLWVLQTTGSGSAMGVVMASRIAVSILLGSVAGVVCDRVNRYRLMIAMDLIRFVLTLLLAALVAQSSTSLALVVPLIAVITVFSTFFNPALQASIVHIVHKSHIQQATGMTQLSGALAQVVGPLLGGTVVALGGGAAAISIDASTFLLSGLLILIGGAFPSPAREGKPASFWADLRAGFAYLKASPLLKAIAVSVPMNNFFGAGATVLLPLIAYKVWKVSAVQFGLVETLFITGAILGSIVSVGAAAQVKSTGQWIVGGTVVMGLLITAILGAPSLLLAAPSLLVLGIFMSLVGVLLNTALRVEVAPEVQGRVFGMLSSVSQVASPLAYLIFGALADAYAPTRVGLLTGFALVVVALLVLFLFPALRKYRYSPR